MSDQPPTADLAGPGPEFRDGPEADIRSSQSFRYPGLEHAFNNPLALRQKGRIVARCTGEEPTHGERRSEGKSPLNRVPRFVEPIQMRQRGSETEIRVGTISIHLDGVTKLVDRLLVFGEIEVGEARDRHPNIGVRITRTETECLPDMGLGLLCATDISFRQTDQCISASEISIQRQRPFAFVYALSSAVGLD